MASNYTPNYGLSQWEATDKVLREDFNVDNAAIDEALFRADRRGLQVIKEVVSTEDTKYLLVEFPEIDWKEWNTVRVIIYSAFNNSADITCHMVFADSVGTVAVHGTQIIFFPSGLDDIAIMGVFLGTTSSAFHLVATKFKNFYSFYLKTDSGIIGAGTKIVFHGEHI